MREVLEKGDFFVSYILDRFVHETALVFRACDCTPRSRFLILEGDHRERYVSTHTVREAIGVFRRLTKSYMVSSFSDDVDEAERTLDAAYPNREVKEEDAKQEAR